jgi:hypothetical protein
VANGASFSYFGDRRLHFIRRLLREWHHQLTNFETLMHNDLPYRYGERTNIGVLTAAALRLKGTVALEEYAKRNAAGPT